MSFAAYASETNEIRDFLNKSISYTSKKQYLSFINPYILKIFIKKNITESLVPTADITQITKHS